MMQKETHMHFPLPKNFWTILPLLLLLSLSGISWGVAPSGEGGRLKKYLTPPARVKDGYTCELKEWLNNPNNINKPLTQEGGLSTGTPWFVIIDRVGVSSKVKASWNAKEKESLRYLDIFMVAEEDGGFLHLAKDSKYDVNKVRFSREVEDHGWIHRSEALVWIKAATTCKNQGKMARKAIPLNTVESLKKRAGSKTDREVFIYEHPDLRESSRSDRRAKLFQIFYIYKESDESFLLGTQPLIYDVDYLIGFGANKDILGWVKKDQVIGWDHRMAIEPNFSPESIEERKIKGSAQAFEHQNKALEYQKGVKVPGAFWKSKEIYRRPGTWRRFPIQGDPRSFKQGMAKVAVMGEITSPFGERSAEAAAKEEQILNARQRNSKTKNVILVVQGNSSMLDYVNETESVLDSIRNLGNNFRLGAVIYRGEGAGTKMINQHINASDNWKNTINFLKRNLQPSSPQASRDGLAMNYGIRTAVKDCGLKEDQSNYLIVLGDKQDSGTGSAFVPMKTLAKDLRAYNCHLMFFQTQHRGTFPYINYSSQAQEILRTIALDDFEKNKGKLKKQLNVKYKPPILEKTEDPTFYFLKNSKSSSVKGCVSGKSLSPTYYGEQLEKIFDGIQQNINAVDYALQLLVREGATLEEVSKQLNLITKETDNPYVSSFSSGIIDFLVDAGLNETQLAQVLSENQQVFATCYAPITRQGHTHPLFIPVLMMTRDEVRDLLNDMEKFLYAQTDEERRRRFYNTWIQLLRAHIGASDFTKEALENMPIEEINEKIFGIPSPPKGILEGVKLADIEEPRIVSNEKLAAYEKEIDKKFTAIKSIWNMLDHEMSFESNETTYYWLEQDLFP
jgi:hypothetical protein